MKSDIYSFKKRKTWIALIGMLALFTISYLSSNKIDTMGLVTSSFSLTEQRLSQNLSYVDDISPVNITLELGFIQQTAEIGKPVKWIKRIVEENSGTESRTVNLTVYLPSYAENISVFDIKLEKEIEREKIRLKWLGKTLNDYEMEKQPEKIKAAAEFVPKAEVEIAEKDIEFEDMVDVNESKEYLVEFYTEPPQVKEEIIGNKKIGTVYSDINYTNILTYTEVGDVPRDRITLYWYASREDYVRYVLVNSTTETDLTYDSYKVDVIENGLFNVSFADSDGNGLIERLEWIVPHLSNQTFEVIIEITKAGHWDENRNFISDIYEEVYRKDDIWSEEIPSEHYVRVTFKKNLTSDRDITIYPRVVSGNPRIEIYEVNENEIIAEFSSLKSNQYNKVYLTNLQGSQDTFDLRVFDGSIEIEHIIDPAGKSMKTVEYFITQDESQRAATVISTYGFSIYIPENNPVVKSAFIEVSGLSAGSTAGSVVTVNLTGGDNATSLTLDGTGESVSYIIRHNSSTLYGLAQGWNGPYSLTVGQTASVRSVTAAKAIITYEYDTDSQEQQKTVYYFIGQDVAGGDRASGAAVSFPFSVCIPESNPKVLSAWAEVEATYEDDADGTVRVNISNASNIAVNVDSTLEAEQIYVLNNASAVYSQGTGCTGYTLYLGITGDTWNAGNARLVMTYNYSASSTEQKTIKRFIVTNNADVASTTRVGYPFSFYIPEDSPVIKSAFVKLTAVTIGTTSATMDVSVDIDGGNLRLHDIDLSEKGIGWTVLYNATALSGMVKGTNGPYTLGVNVTGMTSQVVSAELIVTYDYDSSSTTQQRTIETFAMQRTGASLGPDTLTSDNYTIYISEENPTIQDAFLEVSGSPNPGTAAQTLIVTVTNGTIAGPSISYAFPDPVTNEAFMFRLRYNTTGLYNINSGLNGPFTLGTSYSNIMSALSAKAITTYTYSVVPVGSLTANASFVGTPNITTGKSIDFVGNCTCSGGTCSNVFIISQDNRTGSFTDSTADTGAAVYVNQTNYSIGLLAAASANFCFNVSANTPGPYGFRVQCNSTNAAPSPVNSTGYNLTVNQAYGNLSVALTDPSPGSSTNVPQNRTFWLNATVTCAGTNPTAICGRVNGTARYNSTSTEPDTRVSTTSGDVPFYTTSTFGNPQTCGAMNVASPACQVNWSVNATGNINSTWYLHVNFTSNESSVASNATNTAQINVTFENYVAIGLSSNLSLGIMFGALDPNTIGNNATDNYNGLGNSRNSTYSVDVGTDSNINVDVCIKASAPLTKTDGLVEIPIATYTWDDNLVANHTGMNRSNGAVITTGYLRTNVTNIAGGYSDYFRFWLNIPNDQTPGKYNNTISFKGIVTGAGC